MRLSTLGPYPYRSSHHPFPRRTPRRTANTPIALCVAPLTRLQAEGDRLVFRADSVPGRQIVAVRACLHPGHRSPRPAEAAPTVRSVCRQFGISPAYFQANFPEDNKELVRRSAERARDARTERGRALQAEVHQIVSDLRKKGIYLSLARVRSDLRPDSTRYSPLIRAAIDKVIAGFAPLMRWRDELGRFV